jgi:hypothetical protein
MLPNKGFQGKNLVSSMPTILQAFAACVYVIYGIISTLSHILKYLYSTGKNIWSTDYLSLHLI